MNENNYAGVDHEDGVDNDRSGRIRRVTDPYPTDTTANGNEIN